MQTILICLGGYVINLSSREHLLEQNTDLSKTRDNYPENLDVKPGNGRINSYQVDCKSWAEPVTQVSATFTHYILTCKRKLKWTSVTPRRDSYTKETREKETDKGTSSCCGAQKIKGLVFMELSASQGEKATSSPQRQKRIQPKNKSLKGARARLYIIRRCVVMLLCWKENKNE